MKRYCRLLAIMLGGVLLMTSLSACGQKETIPANRTREQYELEKEFQPLFDFLAEEKKDLSDMEVYGSSIYINYRSENRYESKGVYLGADNLGTYKIEQDNQTQEYPIRYDNSTGHLEYLEAVPEEYDMDIFNLSIKPEFFKELPISDYMAKHPETYLKDITYDIGEMEEYFKYIKDEHNIMNVHNIYITNYSYNSYEIKIEFVDENKIIVITNGITIKEDMK